MAGQVEDGLPQFTTAERVFMVNKYIDTKSPTETIRLFALQFPNSRIPDRKTILRNYTKYIIHGQSTNRNKGNSGRRRTVRTPANINRVQQALQVDPQVSARRNPLHMAPSSFNRITHHDLHWHPYCIQQRNALEPGDPNRRLTFSTWLVNRPAGFIRDIIIGDESTFALNGDVNTHNVRMYAPRNNAPRDFTYDIPNNKQKVLVWAGILGNGDLIGPVFIDGNMNGAKYLEVIDQTIVPHLLRNGRYHQNQNGSIRHVWFFQDGAPCHRAQRVHQRLETLFPGRVVGLGHAIEWPPRSPDLTPLDYFLWGYVKAQVFATDPPPTLAELRRRITIAFNGLRRGGIPRRAVQSMTTRAQRCIALGGGQVEGRAGE